MKTVISNNYITLLKVCNTERPCFIQHNINDPSTKPTAMPRNKQD